MKLSAFVGTSLDGFIARRNGDYDFLPAGISMSTSIAESRFRNSSALVRSTTSPSHACRY
jgi:hypothetical protein